MSREYRRKRTYRTIEERVRFPIDQKSPGKMLRSLREREGVSQNQLAKYLNVNDSLISRWESDTRPIRPSYVDYIAEFLLLFRGEREELLKKVQDEAIRKIFEKI